MRGKRPSRRRTAESVMNSRRLIEPPGGNASSTSESLALCGGAASEKEQTIGHRRCGPMSEPDQKRESPPCGGMSAFPSELTFIRWACQVEKCMPTGDMFAKPKETANWGEISSDLDGLFREDGRRLEERITRAAPRNDEATPTRPSPSGAPQMFVEPRHDLDEIAGARAVVELGGEDAVPAVAAGAGRSWQAEDEGRTGDAGGGAALDRRGADLGVAQHVERDRETVHPLLEQRLDRLRRHVAAGKAGAAGGDDARRRRDRRSSV